MITLIAGSPSGSPSSFFLVAMSTQVGLSTAAKHTARVRLLYRMSLKQNFNFAFARDSFNQMCRNTRKEFEAQKNVQNPGEIESWLTATHNKYVFPHPEPYISMSLLIKCEFFVFFWYLIIVLVYFSSLGSWWQCFYEKCSWIWCMKSIVFFII